MSDLERLPEGLLAPPDDGACNHLPGLRLPALALSATAGPPVSLLAQSGLTVLYVYPRTGQPDQPLPTDWDVIPGARGCTPQSCAFRDHHAELAAAGARVFGLSTQDTVYQREAAQRLHLPFSLLSDADLSFASALKLPTFAVDGLTLLRRVTLIIGDGVIQKMFYPVFPPDQNAAQVLAWLHHRKEDHQKKAQQRG